MLATVTITLAQDQAAPPPAAAPAPASPTNVEPATATAPAVSAQSARELFERLARRLEGSMALLPRMACRFDITGVGSWRISVDRGRVAVEESRESADLAVELPEELLLKVVAGEKQLMTAFMRGEVIVDGEIAYLPALQRLLRSRPASVERQIGK